MKIEFLSKFNQDLNRIHLKSVRNSLLKVIELTQSVETLAEIQNLKKSQGFKSAYRIRIGGLSHRHFYRWQYDSVCPCFESKGNL